MVSHEIVPLYNWYDILAMLHKQFKINPSYVVGLTYRIQEELGYPGRIIPVDRKIASGIAYANTANELLDLLGKDKILIKLPKAEKF